MSTIDRQLLRQLAVFKDLDDASLDHLATLARRRRFEEGETFFYQGDPGHALYVVLSGRVLIRRVTPSGEYLYIAHRGPGEFFGEMALLDGQRRMADAVAASSGELLVVEGDSFIRCLDASPQVARLVAASIGERLREAAERLERDICQDVLGRVADALLERLRIHGADNTPEGLRLKQKVNQQQLADELHTTRESVNRAFHRLREVSVIRTSGRQVIVTDPGKLEAYRSR